MTTVNLKTRILVPICLISALLLSAFAIHLIVDQKEHNKDDFAHSVDTLHGLYQETIHEQARSLAAILEVLIVDNKLRPALSTADRGALLAHTSELFQRLKSKHEITHFYFHDPQRLNLLRVHQPERYGDTIDRFTMLTAARTGEPSFGVELGQFGTLTLRVVAPVRAQGKVIGFIELGREIDQLAADIGPLFKTEVFVAIDKRYLERDEWEVGMRMLNHNTHWDYLPGMVIASDAQSIAPEILKRLTPSGSPNSSPDNIKIEWENRHYRAGSIALQDAGNREVGRLLVLRDMTEQVSSDRITIFSIIGGAILFGALLFISFYWIMKRTERQLEVSQKELHDSMAQLTANEQRMRLYREQTHQGLIEWDADFKVTDWNPAAERIFGYTKSEAMDQHATTLIAPEAPQQGVNTAWQDLMSKQGVLHQIKDGEIRMCEWFNTPLVDMDDNVVGIISLVDDITEQKQTEMISARMGRILESSWNELYVFNAESLNFIQVSEGACQNLGYTTEELRQLTPLDLKQTHSLEHFNALIEPLRQGKQSQITFETEHTRKDGTRYPVEARLQLSSTETPLVFVAIIQDISERKRYIAELEHKALYDALTDLPNRSLLQDRLQHILKVAQREAFSVAVLLVDVVRLKEVNDILGHQNGDQVLQTVAERLNSVLRESDTVARLGGDEFVIVLPTVDNNSVDIAAEKIQTIFEQPIIIDNTSLEIEAAIGIALYPDHGTASDILLQHADIAMRSAKNEAKGYCLYDQKSDPYSHRRLKLHGELRQAINEKSLALYYQPKIDIGSGKIKSVEALARWPHPTEGMIPPDDFIPLVEQSGLIRPFTLWVLERAIEQCKRWIEADIDITIAVNLSTRNLLDPSLPNSITKLLEAHNVSPQRLMLEVTESAIMSRPESSLKLLERLQEMGIKLSIDDFGTGYSSLTYLKKLPVHELKIDYSFISGMTKNKNDAIIVRSTIDLAHNLGLNVVAEGIEDQNTLDSLTQLRCDTGQGFYFSRPLDPEELSRWLIESPWGLMKSELEPEI